MKSRAQLGTGTHDALRPACPNSSGLYVCFIDFGFVLLRLRALGKEAWA